MTNQGKMQPGNGNNMNDSGICIGFQDSPDPGRR